MSKLERWYHHLTNLLVGGTGLVYLVMAWLMTPVDEWSVVNHPWQPTVQHLHLLVAPLLVFAVGLLFRLHIVLRVRIAGRLPLGAGSLLVLLFLPMVASGYALQASSDEAWRNGWAWVHVVSGVLWVLAYLAHLAGRSARAATLNRV